MIVKISISCFLICIDNLLFLRSCDSSFVDSIFKTVVVKCLVISLQIVLHDSVDGDGEASVEDPEEGHPHDDHNTKEEDPELREDCKTIDANSID